MLYFFASLIGLLAILWLKTTIVKNLKGYHVSLHSRDELEYSEKINGKFESIIFDGGMLSSKTPKHIFHLPSHTNWNNSVPEWAANREEFIVSRIKKEFPEPTFKYQLQN